jgi:alkylation response protein AidB-like acyl-CoA dehydrogenase
LTNPDHPAKRKIAEWAESELVDPNLGARDESCQFWAEGWRRIAERGLAGAMVDPDYGGAGLSIFEALLACEGLGYGCRDAGLVFALAGHIWTMTPVIDRFGSDEQRQRLLPGMCSGERIVSFCISEAEAGSDTFAMGTTFVTEDGPEGPTYVINGDKAWVTMAPVADTFIVFATTDPKLGQWGVTAFVVDADTPGLQVGPNRPKMGMRTAPFADVHFEDCRVGSDAVIGSVGSGASIFTRTMETERAFILVGQVGLMERQLADATAFAKTRLQGGRPIIELQAVSHRLAEMKLRYDNARLQMYRAALLLAQGRPVAQAAALAKVQISEASVANSLAAVETFGARGYVTDYGVEADLRNVTGGVIYAGSNDVQRNIISRLLN